ncbi:uncharacterized protein LOC134721523 isoform X2 [Mytilus trossulus]|uniref:uncharacterized protein LOC134721523 isoform X2 n=1 Tax=Mytilus trossulus TaxID=6551 RepID=UPI003004C466
MAFSTRKKNILKTACGESVANHLQQVYSSSKTKERRRRSNSCCGLQLPECIVKCSSDDKDHPGEREKNELMLKVEELEVFKAKYDDQKSENEKLQKKVDQMLMGQSDTTKKLIKTQELFEKLSQDNKKKSDQIEKYQRDVKYMEDRIRNLEIRASEVEKAELILETTKQTLEYTQVEVRQREGDTRRMTAKYEDTCKQLQASNNKIIEMGEKLTDLKYQVRHELMRNENIEKNLETIPRLKDEIKELKEEIDAYKQESNEKTSLLVAARKAVGEYKDKLRDVEQDVEQTERLREDIVIAHNENVALKRIMLGKDCLVIQKSKALDLAKDVISTMKNSKEHDKLDRIAGLLKKIGSTKPNLNDSWSEETDSQLGRSIAAVHHRNKPLSSHTKEIHINSTPTVYDTRISGTPTPMSRNSILDEVNNDTGSCEDLRPKTAIVHPNIRRTSSYKEPPTYLQKTSGSRSSSQNEHIHFRRQTPLSPRSQGDKKISSKFQPLVDYKINVKENGHQDSGFVDRGSSRSSSAWVRHSFSDTVDSGSESEDLDEIPLFRSKMPGKEKDEILKQYVKLGSRIVITVPQKPPKYGRKITPKPKVYTGIVKYVGVLDRHDYSKRVYVGVRLDAPAGSTDGMYNGKRYMYTPPDLGKFFKLCDVTSVLNVQKGHYVMIDALLSKHLRCSTTGRPQSTSTGRTQSTSTS